MTGPTARYETVQAFDMQLDNGGGKTPCAIVSLRVIDGPNTGTNLIWRGYLSEKAAPYTMKSLRALGWTGTKVSKALQEGLGSMKANAQLKTEVWEGKAREKVAGIFPLKERRLTVDNPIEAGDVDAFDALFESAAETVECVPLTDAAKAVALPPTVKKAAAPANPNAVDY
jgi:hypothetical protein